jgi:hypothetical protein
MTLEKRIAETLLTIAQSRPEGSFCPSEAARRICSAQWRPLLPQVRKVAGKLQRQGLLHATQKGVAVDVIRAIGPIRLSKPLH